MLLLDGRIGCDEGTVQLFRRGHNQPVDQVEGAKLPTAANDLRRPGEEATSRSGFARPPTLSFI